MSNQQPQKPISVEVTFTEDRIVLNEDGKAVDRFTKGKTYALTAASAARWIRRGIAYKGKRKKDADAEEKPETEKPTA
jgi:hypothetical protein